MTLPARHRRSNYRILGLVGHGQFGRVYCAVHRRTGRLVAIKLLNRYRLPTHAFLRELRCLLSLDHPNIVACHALEHTADGRQLILEYCEGGTLRSLMESASQLTYAEIFTLMTDVLAGLAHAHQQGIVHCDIKPENILLQAQKGRWMAKISDFGIARLVQDLSVSSLSGHTGSPAYMAPERFYKQYSPASDVYSAGVLLFELLVGHRPFSGTPSDLMDAHLNTPVPIPEMLFEPLKTVALKALEKLPARRYKSAAEMLSALQALELAQPPVSFADTESTPLAWIPYQPFVGQPMSHFPVPVRFLLAASSHNGVSGLTSVIEQSPILEEMSASQDIQRWVVGISPTHMHLQGYAVVAGKPYLKVSTDTLIPQPIIALQPVPRGICLMTASALYGISELADFNDVQLRPIYHWSEDTLAGVSPNGRWFAGVSRQGLKGQLTVGHLRCSNPDVDQWPCVQSKLEVDKTFSLPLEASVEQLFMTDNRHVFLILQTPHRTTQVKILARRGLDIGQIDLGLFLHRFTPTSTPYRFLALDVAHPKSALIVDLKPFRLIRLPLEIEPVFLASMPWGYLFLDAQGRLLILDRDTCPIGCIEGPPNPVAMMPVGNHEVFVATGEPSESNLYAIDLQDFELDILF